MKTVGELIDALRHYSEDMVVEIVYETYAQQSIDRVTLNNDTTVVQIIAENK